MLKHYFGIVTLLALSITYQNVSADNAINDTSTGNISTIINCDKSPPNSTKLPALPSFAWNGSGVITLWFDDGWITQYTNALPIMEKYGFLGAEAIAVKLACYPPFMNWDQLRDMQSKGWETTAHSVMHNCDLGYYTTKTTVYELGGSLQMIQAHGLRADQFVMPCGYSGQQIDDAFENQHPPIIETAKKYYHSYRTTQYERINSIPVADPYNLNAFQLRNTTSDQEIQAMINKAITEHGWLIIVIHQIDDTNRPFSITPKKFTQVLNMVKASKLSVALPSQVLAIKNKASS